MQAKVWHAAQRSVRRPQDPARQGFLPSKKIAQAHKISRSSVQKHLQRKLNIVPTCQSTELGGANSQVVVIPAQEKAVLIDSCL